MVILCEPTPDDIVIFQDTGWESPGTYKFIDDFEKYEGIKVHRVFFEHVKSPGLKGFDALFGYKKYLPNRTKRICTEILKIATSKRYLRKTLGVQEFENYIGFRADEEHRVKRNFQRFKKVHPKYPLYEMGITKEAVDQYWLTRPYRLEIPRIMGNCDLCFLKGKSAIITILQHYPKLADKWINAEENSFLKNGKKASFIKGITYREMLDIAKNQKNLFDVDLAEPAFNCSCNNI